MSGQRFQKKSLTNLRLEQKEKEGKSKSPIVSMTDVKEQYGVSYTGWYWYF